MPSCSLFGFNQVIQMYKPDFFYLLNQDLRLGKSIVKSYTF